MFLGNPVLHPQTIFLSLAAFFFIVARPSFAGEKVSEVFVIKQNSRQGGLETLYLSNNAMRLVQENAGRITIASAPKWNAVVLNPSNRTYFDSNNNTQSMLMQRYMILEGGDLSKCKWHPVEKAKIGSIDAERLVDANCSAKKYDIGCELVPEELKISGFWVASNLQIPSAAANLMARVRGCPPVGKLPLRFIHITKNKNRTVVVDTLSCQRKMMPMTVMSIPPGYKRTLTEYDGGLKESGLLDELAPLSGKKVR